MSFAEFDKGLPAEEVRRRKEAERDAKQEKIEREYFEEAFHVLSLLQCIKSPELKGTNDDSAWEKREKAFKEWRAAPVWTS